MGTFSSPYNVLVNLNINVRTLIFFVLNFVVVTVPMTLIRFVCPPSAIKQLPNILSYVCEPVCMCVGLWLRYWQGPHTGRTQSHTNSLVNRAQSTHGHTQSHTNALELGTVDCLWFELVTFSVCFTLKIFCRIYVNILTICAPSNIDIDICQIVWQLQLQLQIKKYAKYNAYARGALLTPTTPTATILSLSMEHTWSI